MDSSSPPYDTPHTLRFKDAQLEAPPSAQTSIFDDDDDGGEQSAIPLATWLQDNPQEPPKLISVPTIKADPVHGIKFDEACRLRGLMPDFHYAETLPQQFTGMVVFGEHTVSTDGSYPSKKLAKEALCKLALPVVEGMAIVSRKRKSSENEVAGDRVSAEVLNGSNWIGTLQSRSDIARDATNTADTVASLSRTTEATVPSI